MNETNNKNVNRKIKQSYSQEERKLTFRLLFKTTLAVSALTILINAIAGYIIDKHHFEQTYSSMGQEVVTIKEAFESIMLDTSGNKLERAQRFFEAIGKRDSYLSLRLISIDTQVVLSINTAELKRKINLSTDPECKSCHAPQQLKTNPRNVFFTANDERAFHFVLSVENKPACGKCHHSTAKKRATLIADFSLSKYDEEIKNERLEIIIIGLVLLLIFISFLVYLLNSVVYMPLSVIAGRLRRLANLDFSSTPTGRRKDIIGFINLQIDRTTNQLKSLYEHLERKVQERTKSLQESQQALSREKDKLKFIFNNSPQAILGMSTDGEILFTNKRVGELLDISKENLEGDKMQDYALLRQIYEGSIVKTSLTKKSGFMGTEIIFDINHQLKYYEVHVAPVKNEDNQQFLLIMLNDITEEKKLQQNLERHERLASIGQLAAGVAHEVGNPLSAISSLVQLSQKTNAPDLLKHNLDLINLHIDRISRIVRNLSDFVRVSEEKEIDTNIIDILKAAIEITSFDSRSKNVDMKIVIPRETMIFKIKRDQLMQAFLNIIINAIDAVKDVSTPRITITLNKKDNNALIVITDNGVGIAGENLQKIFEPFYTTKPIGKGTGLGLSVTYRIITDMGGDIQVESTVDKGTTFTINLPINN